MGEIVHADLDRRALNRHRASVTEWMLPVFLGLVAGAAAGLFVSVHWSILIVAAFAVVLLSALENETFLLFVIVLLPLSWEWPEGFLRDVMTPLRLLMLVGFFAGRAWRGNLDWRRLWSFPISKTCALFLAIAVVSVMVGPVGWQHDSLAQIYRLISWVGFYFFAVAWIGSRRLLHRVLAAFLVSLCLLGVFSVVQEAVGGYTHLWLYFNPPGPDFIPWTGRAPSLFFYPTALAGCLGLFLPFALASWILGRGKLKVLAGAALGLGFLSLVFSQSLGGLLSFCAVLVLAVVYFVRSWRRRVLLLAGLLASAAAFYLARRILNPAHFAAATKSLPPDVIIRLAQFHAAWVLFLQHPLFGVGFGDFGAVSGGLLPNASWMPSTSLMASNLYLNFMAETGIIGCLVFFFLLFRIARQSCINARTGLRPLGRIIAFGSLGAITTVLVHGLVDYLLLSSQYGTLLFLVMALVVVSSHVRPRQKTFGPTVKSGGMAACV